MNRNANSEDSQFEEVDKQIQLLNKVAENRGNFTSSEHKCAKRMRNLYHNLGAPGIEKFKGILRTNWIKDCPVIESDIDIATEIWGPDVAYLKGKSIKSKSKKFVDDIIQIPAELKI